MADNVTIMEKARQWTEQKDAEEAFVSNVSWYTPRLPEKKLLDVEQFSTDLLPCELVGWVEDSASRLDKSPPDFIAVGAMLSLCALIGRRVGIMPKRNDDWRVVPNNNGGFIAKVSRKKTAQLGEGMRFLEMLDRERRGEYQDAHKAYQVEKDAHDIATKAIKSARPTKGKPLDMEQIKRDLAELQELEPDEPIRRRYLINDSTIEKLAMVEAENPMGLLVWRDELTGWLRSLDREDRCEDRSFYLEGWNGTGSREVDRVGRGNLWIPSHTLSVLGGIQPEKLKPYLHSMVSGHGDDGLLQRFQILVYPDSGKPIHTDEKPDMEARAKAERIYRNLSQLNYHDGLSIPCVRFDDSAQSEFNWWYGNLLVRVDEEPSAHVAAHIGKYASLMPSLALVIELAVRAADGIPDINNITVSDMSTSRAIAWCRYLETHARRIYGLVEDPYLATRQLAERLHDLPNPFRSRDVQRKGWSYLTDNNAVKFAIDSLVIFNYLAPYTYETGGRPATNYHINPEALDKNISTNTPGGG